jgi:hypothetical protein
MKNLRYGLPMLFAVVLLTGCSSKNNDYPPNGLRITPQERKSNEIADLLDLKIWKFSVEFPNPDMWFTWSLETHERNNPPTVLSTGAFRPFALDRKTRNGELVVGLAPLGGEIRLSETIRYIVRIAGNGHSGTFPNPFKGSSQSGDCDTVTHEAGLEFHSVGPLQDSEGDAICLMQGMWTEQNVTKRWVGLYLAAKATTAPPTSTP